MKSLLFKLSVILFCVTSCNKPDNNTPKTCDTNTGSFIIALNGADYDMVVNTETQFTILYNWSGDSQTEFVIDSEDQNGNAMSVEFAIPGEFSKGSSSFSNTTLDNDFFTIDVDTFNLYVSSVTFDVSKSSLNSQDGTYKPVVSTFNGTAHSFPWTNGQPPVNTISFNGSFCLNGIILQ